MNHKRPPVQAIVLLLAVAALTAYFFYSQSAKNKNGALTASGFIEATQANISSEVAGKALVVAVEEGQAIEKGRTVFTLDGGLLYAQRKVAAAQLESARASAQVAQEAANAAQSQYQIVLESALAQDKKTRVQDWFSKDPHQFEQPAWYFSRAEQLQAAQQQVEWTRKAWEEAKARLEGLNVSVEKAAFLAAEARLLQARLAYLTAKDVNYLAENSADANAPVGRYNRTHCGSNAGYRVDDKRLTNLIYGCRGDDYLAQAGDKLIDAAQQELDEAQKAYDALLDTQAAQEVLTARAEVSVAQERYYRALDYVRQLQTGEQSTAVSAAESSLRQAQAALQQAQAAVAQAQANLDLIDEQISKLEIRAPMSGVILTRNIEPGEFVQPGAVAMTMADLDSLTITVYVPEDRYGQVHLGQTAEVRVDSFPGMVFSATVIQIANQAEFTPRNVQTVEGRSATFYAIKLKVEDPQGKLKIGMPADVEFIK